MTRRTRSLILAAVAALGGAAPTMLAGAAPANAAVFAGLDCGIAGELHAIGNFPPTYTLNAVGTAGPYAVPGTNASISCTLRHGSRTGPVITSWGASATDSVVPADVPVVVQ